VLLTAEEPHVTDGAAVLPDWLDWEMAAVAALTAAWMAISYCGLPGRPETLWTHTLVLHIGGVAAPAMLVLRFTDAFKAFAVTSVAQADCS